MPPTAAESVGAAIGATTASMFGGISVADPPPTMDGLTNSYKWLQNIEVRQIYSIYYFIYYVKEMLC